jgi:hypothetical protein
MNTSSDNLRKLIDEIKQRWVMRALKQGGAILFLTFLMCAAFYLLLLYRYELSPLWQTIILGMSLFLMLAVAVQFIIGPLSKRFSDQKIAMFIEEKFPELEDRLNSAVEIETPSFSHEKDSLLDMLIDDAQDKARVVQISTVIDRSREKILSYIALSLLALSILLVFSFRDELGLIASRMMFLFSPNAHIPPEISISPGNIQVEAGESQEILVTLRKQSSDEVILHYRMGSDVWKKETMPRGIDQVEYLYQFVSIQKPVTYYIEFKELVSPEYSISLYEFPKVTRIDLEYTYPSYTGMPKKSEENTGNIRGLKGSDVTLTVRTTGTVEKAELVLDETKYLPLAPQGGGIFSGTIKIKEQGTYYVNLTDSEKKNNKFPDEYLISPVEDELPLITIIDPKRDMRVNSLEEVLISAQAEDDFGVKKLLLKYTVNGDKEQTIDLAKGIAKNEPDVSGSHVMYLEDYSLAPGDIISYYIEAEDNYHSGEPAMTDMYFIEISPFDATFTQVNNQQGGGQQQQQGGQQQNASQMVMSEQMIIAATWKLHRQKNEKTAADFNESLNALVQAQNNLKNNINERVNSTVMSEEMVTSNENMEIANLLRTAVKEMDDAAKMLAGRDLMEALKPEQRALNYLLKADAMNKEKQVQMSRQAANQSGSSGQSSEERMTELMDLEMDISKDKYEIQQQNQTTQSQQMDDAMNKLRELAERQQKIAEQNRTSLPQNEAEARRFLDRLQRDQEELRQQAEELTSRLREMSRGNDNMSRQMQERMEQVAETMRQAEEDLKNNRVQESMSRQQQAMNALNRLQQDMKASMNGNARNNLEEFTQNFDRLQEREQQMSERLNELQDRAKQNNGRITDVPTVRELTAERRAIQENLQTIENQAAAIEKQTLQENPEVATNMRNIRNTMRRESLNDMMEESGRFLQNGWISYSQTLEEMITESLDSLAVQIDKLGGQLPVTEEEQLSRSLTEAREMRQRLEEMMSQAQRNSQSSDSSNREQQNGRQGQSQSQQGQQQGQGQRQSQQGQQQSQGEQAARGQQGQQQARGQQGQQQAQGQQPQDRQQNQGQQGESQNGQQAQNQGQPGQQGGSQGQQGNRQETAGQRGAERDAAVQLERLMDQFNQMLDRMEQDFSEDPAMRQTIETARNSAVADFTGELLGEDAAEHFKKSVFDPLSQLEMYLLERLDEIDMDKKLYSARQPNVPPEYRAMVDRYFESLAKQNNDN